MKNRKDSAKKGFTLVELVIAIALLSIIASLVVVGAHYLSKITGEIMSDTQQQQMTNVSERTIADYLSCAYRIDEYVFEKNKQVDADSINNIIADSILSSNNDNNIKLIYFNAETNEISIFGITSGKSDAQEGDDHSFTSKYKTLTERRIGGILDVSFTPVNNNDVVYMDYIITVTGADGESSELIRKQQPMINFMVESVKADEASEITDVNSVKTSESDKESKILNYNIFDKDGENINNENIDAEVSKVLVLYYENI